MKLFLPAAFAALAFGLSAFAADGDPAFPNQLRSSPQPEQSNPRPRLTTIPEPRSGNNGSAMIPQNGSAMGLGISIPLWRPKQTPPSPEKNPDADSAPDETDDQTQ